MTEEKDPKSTAFVLTDESNSNNANELAVDVEAAEKLMAELKKVASLFARAQQHSIARSEAVKKPCHNNFAGGHAESMEANRLSRDALGDVAGGLYSSAGSYMPY